MASGLLTFVLENSYGEVRKSLLAKEKRKTTLWGRDKDKKTKKEEK
jgi:hypothetical protein